MLAQPRNLGQYCVDAQVEGCLMTWGCSRFFWVKGIHPNGDDEALQARCAHHLRNGEFYTDRQDLVRQLLRVQIGERLAVSNPRCLANEISARSRARWRATEAAKCCDLRRSPRVGARHGLKIRLMVVRFRPGPQNTRGALQTNGVEMTMQRIQSGSNLSPRFGTHD